MAGWLGQVAARLGLRGGLQPLAGEYDLSFRATDAAGPVIVKAMRPGCDAAYVAMQIAALAHVAAADPDLPVPVVRGPAVPAVDDAGAERLVWVQSARPGVALADLPPLSLATLHALGGLAGRLSRGLRGFEHPLLDRRDKWHLPAGEWIADHLGVLSGARRDLVAGALADFAPHRAALAALPVQAIHNDLNDHNILVTPTPGADADAAITGLIDFGDMTRAPVVCDLAILAAYAILDRPDAEAALAALVAGYHAACPLGAGELALIWPLLRLRLAVSVVNSALETATRPDDAYATISQAPAWRLLERTDLDPARILARLRLACGLPVVDHAPAVLDWLAARAGRMAPVIAGGVTDFAVADLSVGGSILPENPFALTAVEAATLGGITHALGRHGEPRLIGTAPAFTGPAASDNRRTVHLGIDLFAPAGTWLHAPLDGVVVRSGIESEAQGYGGVVVLRHDSPAGGFYTLWGHLAPDCTDLPPGQAIAAGTAFARIGAPAENGGWAPHLHLQLGFTDADWPGMADPDDRGVELARFPNPAALLGREAAALTFTPLPEGDLRDYRARHFAANLKLSYRRPVMFLRGWRHHLFDQWGRPWLDAYNNVPHVGHAHPRIRAVAAEQLARMNANTRYLHPAPQAFAEKLLSKLPPEFTVCFFVNSGSEANELALRLARAATGGLDMITPDHGYHGNTTGAMAISAYKFNRPGMGGRPDWVQLIDVPDDFRGRFRANDPDCGPAYAAQVDAALAAIHARGGRLAGFICEVFPSVGGQIIPPRGWLAGVYDRIRAAGGICIADEVQTGLGRLGHHYFAFEQQGAIPDVVVLGKPIGNGHPLAAVVTTRAIARKFEAEAEFFSTFGGSNLSARIGRAVLDIVDDEGLQQNAARMGDRLLAGLRRLQDRHECIGEVRGIGLFVGVDLVTDRDSRAPATALADHVLNGLRDRRILIGREGPADNVLKIRPPLTIDAAGVDRICVALDQVLTLASPG